ncbi:MAG: aldo/keto reductase [Myxococcota bacterium]
MTREVKLADGTSIPALGLGTWKSKPGEVYDAVRSALDVGYRHIDCAAIYGNEQEVGRAFADAISDGTVSRESLWVTSKLWNDAHEPTAVRPALERTLRDLGLEYLDLYLIHWPIAQRPGTTVPRGVDDLVSPEELPTEKTWEAMLKLKSAGLCRQVGVSNFSLTKVQRLQEKVGQLPAMNQVELHPYLQQPDLVAGCQRLGVGVTAYSPLGTPDSASLFGRTDHEPVLEHETIRKIAEARGATPGQVLIAWGLHRGTCSIPKSTKPHRIRENFEALRVDLTSEDMEAVAAMDRSRRQVDGAIFCVGKGYTLASLWDQATPA